jgi:hypothetical protein
MSPPHSQFAVDLHCDDIADAQLDREVNDRVRFFSEDELLERWADPLYEFCVELSSAPGRWTVRAPNGDSLEFSDLYDLRQFLDELPFVIRHVVERGETRRLSLIVGSRWVMKFERESAEYLRIAIVDGDRQLDDNDRVRTADALSVLLRFLLRVRAVGRVFAAATCHIVEPWFAAAIVEVHGELERIAGRDAQSPVTT